MSYIIAALSALAISLVIEYIARMRGRNPDVRCRGMTLVGIFWGFFWIVSPGKAILDFVALGAMSKIVAVLWSAMLYCIGAYVWKR